MLKVAEPSALMDTQTDLPEGGTKTEINFFLEKEE